jgi:hypothetical protein
MLGDGGRDAFRLVSGEAGAEQVVGVGGVAVGAGGTHGGAPVSAGGQDGPGSFEQDRAVSVEDLRGARQVDGGGAAADGLDLSTPLLVVGGAQAGAELVDDGQAVEGVGHRVHHQRSPASSFHSRSSCRER